MRPISFLKGTLLLRFPSEIVLNTTKIMARKLNEKWCVALYDKNDNILIIGKGKQVYDRGEIVVTGSQTKNLPNWWTVGNEIYPEKWIIAQMFGTTSKPIDIGKD